MQFYDRSEGDYGNIEAGISRQCRNDFSIYAAGYYRAAKQLANIFLEKSVTRDYEGYPVVFLYRHALELYLKHFILGVERIKDPTNCTFPKATNTHQLPQLYDDFEGLIMKIPEMAEDPSLKMFLRGLKSLVQGFNGIDPFSESFRYPLNKKGNAFPKMKLKVGDIRDAFEGLEGDLEAMSLCVSAVGAGARDAVVEEYFVSRQEEDYLKDMPSEY